MIDIHAHILPGMDDGAEDMKDTLEMAQIAVENGITAMIATPHCNLPGIYDNYYDSQYTDTYVRVCEKLEEHGIPLKLLPGMEVFGTPDIPRLIRDGKLKTLNDSRYLLVEFPFEEDIEYMENILEGVLGEGLIPVIAHCERYEAVQKNIYAIDDWKKKGCLIQVNKASLVGKFGRYSYNAAHTLMKRRLVDVVATDCHRPYHRTPVIVDVYEKLDGNYTREYLEKIFNENPRKICLDQEI